MKTIESPEKLDENKEKVNESLFQEKPEENQEPKRVLEKTPIIARKLTEYELRLYEYSSFSLNEEIDIFYCSKNNLDFDQ